MYIKIKFKERELVKMRNKLRTLHNDLTMSDLALQDVTKRANESAGRLTEFQLVCEGVKNERNRYVLLKII